MKRMCSGRGLWALGGMLAVALCGCNLGILDPAVLSALGLGPSVPTLPGDAPGLLVTLENRTDRWVTMVVAYREESDATSYTSTIGPLDKTAQMLTCPITELTVGDVSGLDQSGVRVYLVDSLTGDGLVGTPYIEVDAFGTLLKEGINYDCGDGVTFAVQPSSATRSGYQIFAYISRAGS